MINKIRDRTAKICIVGLGYVGLPTAICFAEKGFEVIGCDKKDDVVNSINSGCSHLDDLQLDGRIEKVVKNKKLRATINTAKAVGESDVIIIIVSTPLTKDKRPDMSFIKSVSEEVAKGLKPNSLVIVESSVYPGATEEFILPILEKSGLKAGKDFGLASCPERYSPGDPNYSIEKVSRIIGGINRKWAETAKEFYQTIVNGKVTIVKNIKTAEAGKLMENIQRDLNIALMNEFALIFEKMGMDIMDVIKASSTKWNFKVFYPGPGVGGGCLPINPYYLIKRAEELGFHSKLITAGRSVNDYMPLHVFNLLLDGLNEAKKSLKNSNVVILGVSYKKNVGDIRHSPAIQLIKKLKTCGASVIVVDPLVKTSDIKQCGVEVSEMDKLCDFDAIVLMTDHNRFKNLNFSDLTRKSKSNPVFVEGRRVYDPKLIKKLGFIYRGIGFGGDN